jgi:hypothetical protein
MTYWCTSDSVVYPSADPPLGKRALWEIGVRLLPERLLSPEEIVEQHGDGVGHGIRIQIVVQRVVAEAGGQARAAYGCMSARKTRVRSATTWRNTLSMSCGYVEFRVLG